MPASVTPRRMKGATEVGRSMPCASPQAATAPPYLVMLQHVGERVAADRIDGPGPALLVERPAGLGQLGAVDDLRRPEALQIVGLRRPRPVEAITW